MSSETCSDCNSDKDGKSKCSYTANNIVILMQMLMVFYYSIGFPDRTTRVICSIIIVKPTQTLHTLLRYISPICLIHLAANLRATINETA